MGKNSTASGDKIVQIDESKIHSHLDRLVRSTIDETINNLLDSEAEQLCNAGRYERSDKRQDYRAGHYSRKLHTKAGEVEVKMPKLRKLPFETAIIERYRRREASVEEALMERYLAGVSVRRVEDITEALWGNRVSAGTISRLNQNVKKRIEAWRHLPVKGEYI
jgi:transposase-like protein